MKSEVKIQVVLWLTITDEGIRKITEKENLLFWETECGLVGKGLKVLGLTPTYDSIVVYKTLDFRKNVKKILPNQFDIVYFSSSKRNFYAINRLNSTTESNTREMHKK